VKNTTATLLFGRGGMELLPVLAKLSTAEELTKKSAEDLTKALGGDVATSAEALKAQIVNFRQEAETLEVSLARNVIPALISFIGVINRTADNVKAFYGGTGIDVVTQGLSGAARSRGLQLTPGALGRIPGFVGSTFRGDIGSASLQATKNPEAVLDQFI